MVLDFLKRVFRGPPDLDPYERQVLEREHRELSREIASLRDRVSSMPAGKSKKKMNPQAKAVLNRIDQLEKRQQEIERQLGGAPEAGGARSRRSKRSG